MIARISIVQYSIVQDTMCRLHMTANQLAVTITHIPHTPNRRMLLIVSTTLAGKVFRQRECCLLATKILGLTVNNSIAFNFS